MRATRRACFLLALAAAIGTLAAGCGGSSSNGSSNSPSGSGGFSAYETQMQALGQQLGVALAGIGQSNVGKAPIVIAQHLVTAQVQLRKAAVKLAAITPPAAIKADHALLLKGVREYAAGLEPLIKELRAPAKDNLAYLTVLRKISSLKGVRDMQSATLAITKAGYLITIKG